MLCFRKKSGKYAKSEMWFCPGFVDFYVFKSLKELLILIIRFISSPWLCRILKFENHLRIGTDRFDNRRIYKTGVWIFCRKKIGAGMFQWFWKILSLICSSFVTYPLALYSFLVNYIFMQILIKKHSCLTVYGFMLYGLPISVSIICLQ